LDSNLNGTLAFFSRERGGYTKKRIASFSHAREEMRALLRATSGEEISFARASGLFSSRALKIKSRFLCEFYKRGTRARILCSFFLMFKYV